MITERANWDLEPQPLPPASFDDPGGWRYAPLDQCNHDYFRTVLDITFPLAHTHDDDDNDEVTIPDYGGYDSQAEYQAYLDSLGYQESLSRNEERNRARREEATAATATTAATEATEAREVIRYQQAVNYREATRVDDAARVDEAARVEEAARVDEAARVNVVGEADASGEADRDDIYGGQGEKLLSEEEVQALRLISAGRSKRMSEEEALVFLQAYRRGDTELLQKVLEAPDGRRTPGDIDVAPDSIGVGEDATARAAGSIQPEIEEVYIRPPEQVHEGDDYLPSRDTTPTAETGYSADTVESIGTDEVTQTIRNYRAGIITQKQLQESLKGHPGLIAEGAGGVAQIPGGVETRPYQDSLGIADGRFESAAVATEQFEFGRAPEFNALVSQGTDVEDIEAVGKAITDLRVNKGNAAPTRVEAIELTRRYLSGDDGLDQELEQRVGQYKEAWKQQKQAQAGVVRTDLSEENAIGLEAGSVSTFDQLKSKPEYDVDLEQFQKGGGQPDIVAGEEGRVPPDQVHGELDLDAQDLRSKPEYDVDLGAQQRPDSDVVARKLGGFARPYHGDPGSGGGFEPPRFQEGQARGGLPNPDAVAIVEQEAMEAMRVAHERQTGAYDAGALADFRASRIDAEQAQGAAAPHVSSDAVVDQEALRAQAGRAVSEIGDGSGRLSAPTDVAAQIGELRAKGSEVNADLDRALVMGGLNPEALGRYTTDEQKRDALERLVDQARTSAGDEPSAAEQGQIDRLQKVLDATDPGEAAPSLDATDPGEVAPQQLLTFGQDDLPQGFDLGDGTTEQVHTQILQGLQQITEAQEAEDTPGADAGWEQLQESLGLTREELQNYIFNKFLPSEQQRGEDNYQIQRTNSLNEYEHYISSNFPEERREEMREMAEQILDAPDAATGAELQEKFNEEASKQQTLQQEADNTVLQEVAGRLNPDMSNVDEVLKEANLSPSLEAYLRTWAAEEVSRQDESRTTQEQLQEQIIEQQELYFAGEITISELFDFMDENKTAIDALSKRQDEEREQKRAQDEQRRNLNEYAKSGGIEDWDAAVAAYGGDQEAIDAITDMRTALHRVDTANGGSNIEEVVSSLPENLRDNFRILAESEVERVTTENTALHEASASLTSDFSNLDKVISGLPEHLRGDFSAWAAPQLEQIEAEKEEAADFGNKLREYNNKLNAAFREKHGTGRGGYGIKGTVDELQLVKSFYADPQATTGVHYTEGTFTYGNGGQKAFEDLSVEELYQLQQRVNQDLTHMGQQSMLDSKQYVRDVSGGEMTFAQSGAAEAAAIEAARVTAARAAVARAAASEEAVTAELSFEGDKEVERQRILAWAEESGIPPGRTNILLGHLNQALNADTQEGFELSLGRMNRLAEKYGEEVQIQHPEEAQQAQRDTDVVEALDDLFTELEQDSENRIQGHLDQGGGPGAEARVGTGTRDVRDDPRVQDIVERMRSEDWPETEVQKVIDAAAGIQDGEQGFVSDLQSPMEAPNRYLPDGAPDPSRDAFPAIGTTDTQDSIHTGTVDEALDNLFTDLSQDSENRIQNYLDHGGSPGAASRVGTGIVDVRDDPRIQSIVERMRNEDYAESEVEKVLAAAAGIQDGEQGFVSDLQSPIESQTSDPWQAQALRLASGEDTLDDLPEPERARYESAAELSTYLSKVDPQAREDFLVTAEERGIEAAVAELPSVVTSEPASQSGVLDFAEDANERDEREWDAWIETQPTRVQQLAQTDPDAAIQLSTELSHGGAYGDHGGAYGDMVVAADTVAEERYQEWIGKQSPEVQELAKTDPDAAVELAQEQSRGPLYKLADDVQELSVDDIREFGDSAKGLVKDTALQSYDTVQSWDIFERPTAASDHVFEYDVPQASLPNTATEYEQDLRARGDLKEYQIHQMVGEAVRTGQVEATGPVVQDDRNLDDTKAATPVEVVPNDRASVAWGSAGDFVGDTWESSRELAGDTKRLVEDNALGVSYGALVSSHELASDAKGLAGDAKELVEDNALRVSYGALVSSHELASDAKELAGNAWESSREVAGDAWKSSSDTVGSLDVFERPTAASDHVFEYDVPQANVPSTATQYEQQLRERGDLKEYQIHQMVGDAVSSGLVTDTGPIVQDGRNLDDTKAAIPVEVVPSDRASVAWGSAADVVGGAADDAKGLAGAGLDFQRDNFMSSYDGMRSTYDNVRSSDAFERPDAARTNVRNQEVFLDTRTRTADGYDSSQTATQYEQQLRERGDLKEYQIHQMVGEAVRTGQVEATGPVVQDGRNLDDTAAAVPVEVLPDNRVASRVLSDTSIIPIPFTDNKLSPLSLAPVLGTGLEYFSAIEDGEVTKGEWAGIGLSAAFDVLPVGALVKGPVKAGVRIVGSGVKKAVNPFSGTLSRRGLQVIEEANQRGTDYTLIAKHADLTGKPISLPTAQALENAEVLAREGVVLRRNLKEGLVPRSPEVLSRLETLGTEATEARKLALKAVDDDVTTAGTKVIPAVGGAVTDITRATTPVGGQSARYTAEEAANLAKKTSDRLKTGLPPIRLAEEMAFQTGVGAGVSYGLTGDWKKGAVIGFVGGAGGIAGRNIAPKVKAPWSKTGFGTLAYEGAGGLGADYAGSRVLPDRVRPDFGKTDVAVNFAPNAIVGVYRGTRQIIDPAIGWRPITGTGSEGGTPKLLMRDFGTGNRSADEVKQELEEMVRQSAIRDGDYADHIFRPSGVSNYEVPEGLRVRDRAIGQSMLTGKPYTEYNEILGKTVTYTPPLLSREKGGLAMHATPDGRFMLNKDGFLVRPSGPNPVEEPMFWASEAGMRFTDQAALGGRAGPDAMPGVGVASAKEAEQLVEIPKAYRFSDDTPALEGERLGLPGLHIEGRVIGPRIQDGKRLLVPPEWSAIGYWTKHRLAAQGLLDSITGGGAGFKVTDEITPTQTIEELTALAATGGPRGREAQRLIEKREALDALSSETPGAPTTEELKALAATGGPRGREAQRTIDKREALDALSGTKPPEVIRAPDEALPQRLIDKREALDELSSGIPRTPETPGTSTGRASSGQQPITSATPPTVVRLPEVVRPDITRLDPVRLDPVRLDPVRPEIMRPEITRPEITRPVARPDPRPEIIRPDPRPEITRPDPRPEITRPDPRPEITRPDPRPEITRPDPRPEITRPDPRPEITRPDPRPEITRPDPRPEIIRPEITRPEITRPDPRPDPRPEITRPEITRPEITRPEITRPEITRPEITRPEITRPEITRPEITRPEITRPEITRPEITRPEITRPEITRPEITRPEITRPEITRPEITRPEITRPEITRPEITRPEITRPEITRPEITRPEITRPEITRPEITRPQVTRPIRPKVVRPRLSLVRSRIRPDIPDIKIEEKPATKNGKFANEAIYEITSRIKVDIKTGEQTSELVNRTPVNLDYQSPVPLDSKELLGRNIDIMIDRSGVPSVRQVKERQLVSDAFGLSTKGGKYNENRRGRGRRERRGR